MHVLDFSSLFYFYWFLKYFVALFSISRVRSKSETKINKKSDSFHKMSWEEKLENSLTTCSLVFVKIWALGSNLIRNKTTIMSKEIVKIHKTTWEENRSGVLKIHQRNLTNSDIIRANLKRRLRENKKFQNIWFVVLKS